VKGTNPRILKEGTKTFLSFPWGVHSEFPFFDSTNLANWNKRRVGYYGETPGSGNLEVTFLVGANTQQFYRVPQVVYPTPSLEPTSLVGSKMVYTFGTGPTAQVLTLNFTGANSGTFTLTNPTTAGQILAYTWTREYDIYEARLSCTLEGSLGTQVLGPIFGTASGGVFKYGTSASPAGAFTYTPASAPFAATQAASSLETEQTAVSTASVTKRTTRRAKRER
jgi:hypothetical protein